MENKGKNANTVESSDTRNCNKNEDCTVAVHQVSRSKKLNGRRYKELLKSLVKKVKGSDLSIQEKDKLSQSVVNVTEVDVCNKGEATNADGSPSHSQEERVDFLLRRNRKNNTTESQGNLDVSKLEIKLTHCVAYECKSTTTHFMEYWVPVKLCNLQIEQYCGSLFSNARLLCSCLKHDSANMLQDVIISTRQCCDHPYLVDWSFHTSLIQGIPEPEQLDAEIKLSSKLFLLHKILLEIKKRGLRLLILYQSLGRSGSISTGDILDDIIHQKFGEDSFVRIGGGISRSKKRAALMAFNDKGCGRFVCLMETRACLPSIKLASIDTVIFFNSDWDPMNDIRALQKINLNSQFEKVKVFRLYSSYTVEEKVLILSKQGMTLDGNIANTKQSTCHGLLTWGAPYLFKKLDEFHNLSTSDTHSVISYGDSFVEDVFLELSTLLPNNGEKNVCTNSSFIMEVQPTEGIYPRNISLLGEEESPFADNLSLVDEMMDKEPPHVFWIKLLEGRKPRWKYFSSQSTRTRKSIRRFDDQPEESDEADRASKKCRIEAIKTVYQTLTVRQRTGNKLQSHDKQGKLSGAIKYDLVNKVKYNSAQSAIKEKVTSWLSRQSKAAAWTQVQTPMPDNPSSAEHHSLLPPNEHDHVPSSINVPNGHTHGTTSPSCQTEVNTHPLVEDSTKPLGSSVQNSTVDVPQRSARIASHMTEDGREPSMTLNSGNCQPPKTSQITHFEALQSVCKALQIELERLQKKKTEFIRQHEDMKLRTKMACEKEIDQICKKYDMLVQKAEMAFVEEKNVLETKYNKINMNKSLAEAVVHRDNSKNATLSQVTANCSIEEMHELFFQWTDSIRLTRPELAENLPIPPAIQGMIPSFAVKPTNEEMILPGMNASRMNYTSLVQTSRADLISSTHNPPVGILGSFQAGYEIRAPAPHLRYARHPLPITEPKLSSPRAGIIYSSVNIGQGVSRVKTSCSPSVPGGVPLGEH